jgi:hypothetical protein
MTGRGTVTLDGLMFRQFFDVIGYERLQVTFYGANAPLVAHAGPDHDFIMMPLTRDDKPVKPAPAPEAAPVPPAVHPEAPVVNGEAEPKGRGKGKK